MLAVADIQQWLRFRTPNRKADPMFVILLKFAENKAQAAQHMEGHKAWLNEGFKDGVFLLAGSLQPGLGGAILAHNTSLAELEDPE